MRPKHLVFCGIVTEHLLYSIDRRCTVLTVCVSGLLYMGFYPIVGETGASCYTFYSKSLFHKNMPARDFFGRDRVI